MHALALDECPGESIIVPNNPTVSTRRRGAHAEDCGEYATKDVGGDHDAVDGACAQAWHTSYN